MAVLAHPRWMVPMPDARYQMSDAAAGAGAGVGAEAGVEVVLVVVQCL